MQYALALDFGAWICVPPVQTSLIAASPVWAQVHNFAPLLDKQTCLLATGPFWLNLLFIRHLNILFFLDLNLLFFLDCYPLVLDSCTCTKLCYGMPTCCCWTRCDSSTRPQQCYLSRMGPTWIHNLLIWMESYYFLTFFYLCWYNLLVLHNGPGTVCYWYIRACLF